jgi:hypothetical protein
MLDHPLLTLVSVAIYFFPSIVGRDKRNSSAIFVLNLLLGWTLIGWVVALVWAMTKDNTRSPA